MRYNRVVKRIPEANIQAELYRKLQEAWLFVILEYKIKWCRLDVAIFQQLYWSYSLVLAIEVKSYKTHKQFNYDTKQINKYRDTLWLEILWCWRMEDVDWVVRKVIDIAKGK